MESMLVCVLCLPLPSLHLFDFYEIFFYYLFVSFFTFAVHFINNYMRMVYVHSLPHNKMVCEKCPMFSTRAYNVHMHVVRLHVNIEC